MKHETRLTLKLIHNSYYCDRPAGSNTKFISMENSVKTVLILFRLYIEKEEEARNYLLLVYFNKYPTTEFNSCEKKNVQLLRNRNPAPVAHQYL